MTGKSVTLTKTAAIRLVDERENEARQRFEQLKSEMTGRGAAANLIRGDGGERDGGEI